jgi:hypothetical protein
MICRPFLYDVVYNRTWHNQFVAGLTYIQGLCQKAYSICFTHSTTTSFLSSQRSSFQLFMSCHYSMSLRWIMSVFQPKLPLHSHKCSFREQVTTLHYKFHHFGNKLISGIHALYKKQDSCIQHVLQNLHSIYTCDTKPCVSMSVTLWSLGNPDPQVSGQFWADYSPVFPIYIIITGHYHHHILF